MHAPELQAASGGDAVVVRAVVLLDDEHGRRGQFRSVEPRDRLPFGDEELRWQVQQLRCPRAGAEDETIGLVDTGLGDDLDAAAGARPVEDGLVRQQDRAGGTCGFCVRMHRSLGFEVTAVGLEDGDVSARHAYRRRLDELVAKTVFSAGSQRAGDDDAVLGADVEGSDDVEKARIELAPQLVRAPKQRDVVGMLVVGEADDARFPVHRASVVHDSELLDPEHAPAAARELVGGRSAHRPEPDDDRVVAAQSSACTRPSSLPLASISRSTSPRSTFELEIPYVQRQRS